MKNRCWNKECQRLINKYGKFYVDGKGHKFCSLGCLGAFKKEDREKAITRSEDKWDKKLKFDRQRGV